MIFSKTTKTVIKKIWRNTEQEYKGKAVYRVTTYWFLFIPVYTTQLCID